MQSTIRKQLLKLFSEHEGEFLSGQMLSDSLGCSRTAVWKHIEDLRKDGFQLEAVQRKGYRIIAKPNRLSANEIQLGLKTTNFGRVVYYEESVPSTQKIAHKLSYEDVPEGTIIVSEEQVSGKGRLDRSWFSPKFSGIWFSIILRPTIPPQKAPQLTLLAAVSVVRGIKAATGIQCAIKWPNDILLNDKKLVGILTELQAETDRIHAVIIGIGINVNQLREHFPDDLREKATSLLIETGKEWNRSEIVQAILFEMEELYNDYLENGFQVVKLLWESYAVSIGRKITARTITNTLSGTALGITDDGVLLLQDDSGDVHHIYSADIELN